MAAVTDKPTAPDWLWSEDRKLLPTVFSEIEALSGHTFTLDAAANANGDNAHCIDYCSPADSFMSRTHTGHIWINSPFSQLTAFLQHYLHCKQSAPDSTSGCILVPGYLLPMLKSLLSGMRLLKKFNKGTAIFEQSSRSGHQSTSPSVHWPMYVYTDVPSDAYQAMGPGQNMHRLHNAVVVATANSDMDTHEPDGHLAVLFEGRFGGGPHDGLAPVLLDSGASANFVSPGLLQTLGISYPTSSATLRLADNSEAPTLGRAKLRFKLQHFLVVADFYVTELCSDFDIILGNSFMVKHKAVLDYANFTASVQRHGKRYTLSPQFILTDVTDYDSKATDKHVRNPYPKPPSPAEKKASKRMNRSDWRSAYNDCFDELDRNLVLSCAQARKSIRKGCRSFLVLVTEADIAAAQVNSAVISSDSAPVVAPPVVAAEQADLHAHVDTLKQQYADVFAEPSGLPPDRGVEHVIPLLPDSQPPFQRMYRLSPTKLQEVQRQVTDLLAKQLIEPSTSPYGAPILFVEKKTGDLRMVVDYRALNKITVKNRYPLPRIDDLFDKLFGAQYFSCLDATSGFHQILLKAEDRPKTAFRTPFGHYQYKVLPFGLTNAPGTFQAVMNNVFDDGSINPMHELSKFALVFIDDILIFSKTAADHKRHIEIVLAELRKQSILIKASKCVWGQTELPYLGHIIGRDGIKPDPKKVQSVVEWPAPTCWREVQQFLGLTNFFIKFIQGYANLTKPLTDLGKKDVEFKWDSACQKSFDGLKHALSNAPVLALADPDEHFELVCDASGFGIGAVLMQKGRPLVYYSRKMTAAERNYVVTEQELLATVEALRVFRCYLLSGQQFTLVTDNKPNTYLQTQPTLSRRQARWSEYLQRFHFSWLHREGRRNVADPLSRNPDFKQLNALIAVMKTRAQQKPASPSSPSASGPAKANAKAGQKRKSDKTPASGVNTIELGKRRRTVDSTSQEPSAELVVDDSNHQLTVRLTLTAHTSLA